MGGQLSTGASPPVQLAGNGPPHLSMKAKHRLNGSEALARYLDVRLCSRMACGLRGWSRWLSAIGGSLTLPDAFRRVHARLGYTSLIP